MPLLHQPRRRHHQRRKGALGVDGPPPVEDPILEADGQLRGYGVHVAAQEHPGAPLAVLPDDIADGVTSDGESQLRHPGG